MTGRLRRKAMAKQIHLLYNRDDGMTLPNMKWSPKMLKRELVSMLQRAELAPLDLVRAWDQSKDFSFSSREFMVRTTHSIILPCVQRVHSSIPSLYSDAPMYQASMCSVSVVHHPPSAPVYSLAT